MKTIAALALALSVTLPAAAAEAIPQGAHLEAASEHAAAVS